MFDWVHSLFDYQAASSGSREGLPFWIFWFLLCIILLLVTFIFLRDKDLRQRLSAFLSSAKRKVQRMRLQSKLKKEEKRKADLIKELGRISWSENIRVEKGEAHFTELQVLEEKRIANQRELDETLVKIDELNKKFEEHKNEQQLKIQEQQAGKKPHDEKLSILKEKQKQLDKDLGQTEKEITAAEKSLDSAAEQLQTLAEDVKLSEEQKKAKTDELNQAITAHTAQKEELSKKIPPQREEKSKLTGESEELEKIIREYEARIGKIEETGKEKKREFEKSIKEWEKKRDKVKEKLAEVEKQKEPVFDKLGQVMNEVRLDNPALTPLYSQIDNVKSTIQDFKTQIENLRK